MFDLVIKDAEIYDGAGNEPVRGDLGVTNGKVSAISAETGSLTLTRSTASAKRGSAVAFQASRSTFSCSA